jgi:hypothetical protein
MKNTKDSCSNEEKIWHLCRDVAMEHSCTRRLVSLNEANDVARRVGDLAAASKKDEKRLRLAARGYDVSDDAAEQEGQDIVADWMNEATAWET